MKLEWFRSRGYRHFDAPVGASYASKVSNPLFVTQHAWLPLIRYVKRIKRYKKLDRKTTYKDRPIMIASHRDACILTKYAFDIVAKLDQYYKEAGLDKYVIAYRKLGRANYDFSADAQDFIRNIGQGVVLCFDITGFFDNLDHALLKNRLKRLLGVKELTPDWYAVFRHVARFKVVERSLLEANPDFQKRMEMKSREPIATISEINKAGIPIDLNPNKFGIPQGTPISSALSNLYMMDLDKGMVDICAKSGGLYQRYSDDILIICPLENEVEITEALKAMVKDHRLEIKDEKTERAVFGSGSEDSFQYLGFSVSKSYATIRPASLARQWRKAKRAIRRTKRIGEQAIAKGRSEKIYTKKLRRRFSPVGVRNFSQYARRASIAFESKQIRRQIARFERMVDKEIREIET